MSQARLNSFLQKVQVANPKFTEKRSCLQAMLTLMRQQVTSGNFNLNALTASIASARADKRGAKYQTALQYVENTWGKTTLEYKGPNQVAFANLTGAIYLLKTTQVTFREVDTGTQATHTFSINSASNNPAGEVTANIAFGPQTHAVKAIVFELTPTLVFGDPFVGRSQTDVGVNEHVTLGFTSVPVGVSAVQAGNLLWTPVGAVDASADRQRQLKGKLQTANGNVTPPVANGAAYFIAPWATDAAYPMGPRPSQLASEVKIRLVIQSGPSQGLYVEQTLNVHTPQARMVATPPYQHVSGKPSAGFTGDIYFDPKDVSFRYIKFKEGRGTMVAKQTGFKAAQSMSIHAPVRQLPPAPSGYFAWEGARVHAHTPIWVDIANGDTVNGCKLTGSDNVYSGFNSHWPAKYTSAHGTLNGKETDAPSELSWPINWLYRADDLAGAVTSQKAVHKAVMEASGKVTMSKAGASISRDLGDPTA